MAYNAAASRELHLVLLKDEENLYEVKRLVEEEGADPNWRPGEGYPTNTGRAAWKGFVRSLRFLARRGGDVNIQAWGGDNTLHEACYYNHPAAACVVVAFGGDTTAKSVSGRVCGCWVGCWGPPFPRRLGREGLFPRRGGFIINL